MEFTAVIFLDICHVYLDRGWSETVVFMWNGWRNENTVFPSKAFPNGEGCDTRIPLFSHRQSEYTHMWKKNNDGQSLPRVGKVASVASRIGFWRYEKERRRSSQVGDIDERGSVSSTSFTRAPYPPLRGPPSPRGEGGERSEPDRVLAVWKRGGDRLRSTIYESTLYKNNL